MLAISLAKSPFLFKKSFNSIREQAVNVFPSSLSSFFIGKLRADLFNDFWLFLLLLASSL